MMVQISFLDGFEMLDKIQNYGIDLYNTELELYAFCYNECGSIATYNIDKENALKFELKTAAVAEYWSAFLGPGGQIHDSSEYKIQSNLEDTGDDAVNFCNNYFDKGVWMAVN